MLRLCCHVVCYVLGSGGVFGAGTQGNTPQDWQKLAHRMMETKQYGLAAKCFRSAGDGLREEVAQAYQLVGEVRGGPLERLEVERACGRAAEVLLGAVQDDGATEGEKHR